MVRDEYIISPRRFFGRLTNNFFLARLWCYQCAEDVRKKHPEKRNVSIVK